MANLLAQNPWVLDGTGAGSVLVKNQIKIKHFEYVGYASGLTSIATLTNALGDTLWSTTGTTDGVNQRSGTVGWVQGLILVSITDGKILVYFD